ncbi:hypothetical protein CIHG_00620 [Coccidioides immitis H538.4]|uniref:Uncharacterized protein n=3 Tax=Coccidioides immitis TaxID=5501 RepID=A0A0J8TE47_COCIT|nr:hypothetical protein CIRG_07429 [Coccidioides immitis RMSCC 2394]KMU71797.1 hypothetical protein CISG_00107 [Coccidioides immitis RMSCC 3703]KMU82837.1 hypothetical protein CIHG_00620 [Coccidioides immitis H538.4]
MHIRGPLDQLEQLVHTIHSDCLLHPTRPTRKSLHVCSMMGECPPEAQWPYQLPEYRAWVVH